MYRFRTVAEAERSSSTEDVGGERDRFGPYRPGHAVMSHEPACGLASNHSGPTRIFGQKRACKHELALRLEPSKPFGAIRRCRGLERLGGLSGPPACEQHLGTVLLDVCV